MRFTIDNDRYLDVSTVKGDNYNIYNGEEVRVTLNDANYTTVKGTLYIDTLGETITVDDVVIELNDIKYIVSEVTHLLNVIEYEGVRATEEFLKLREMLRR